MGQAREAEPLPALAAGPPAAFGTAAPQVPARGLTLGRLAGVLAGNGLEFYDFLTFSFFAVQIGRALFPPQGGHALLLALVTFGVGFLTRPLGAAVIGRLADRRGRKPATLLSFACMGVALAGLALTPPYATIGWAAPVLAVAFRLLQGFALGGEMGPNTAFLVEAAPEGRRGLYVSLQYATQDGAVMAAGLVGLALSSALTPAALGAWGWRLAFLLGVVIVPFGLRLRRTLIETLQPPAHAPAAPPLRARLGVAVGGLTMLGAGAVATYTLGYLNAFAQTTLGIRAAPAFAATAAVGVAGVAVDLLAGALTDRFGRKAMLLPPWLLLAVLTLPAFALLSHLRTGAALMAVGVGLACLLSACKTPALVLLTEAAPPHARAASVGLTYALAIAIFGGGAQAVEQLLVEQTGSALAPAACMTAALLVGLGGVALLPERRRARVGDPEAAAIQTGASPCSPV